MLGYTCFLLDHLITNPFLKGIELIYGSPIIQAPWLVCALCMVRLTIWMRKGLEVTSIKAMNLSNVLIIFFSFNFLKFIILLRHISNLIKNKTFGLLFYMPKKFDWLFHWPSYLFIYLFLCFDKYFFLPQIINKISNIRIIFFYNIKILIKNSR